nr:hypothetical protein [Aeromonas hydrophila]
MSLIELNRQVPSPIRSEVIKVGQVIYVPSASQKSLPQLGNAVTGDDVRHSQAEVFLAGQANHLRQAYGQNDSAEMQAGVSSQDVRSL